MCARKRKVDREREKRSQERKGHRRERITGEERSQERKDHRRENERRHRTCTPHLSDSPGSLCVHGRVGSPCEGVLAR